MSKLGYLTNEQVSKELSISIETLKQWRKKGLKYYKPDRKIYYKIDDLREFIEGKTNGEEIKEDLHETK